MVLIEIFFTIPAVITIGLALVLLAIFCVACNIELVQAALTPKDTGSGEPFILTVSPGASLLALPVNPPAVPVPVDVFRVKVAIPVTVIVHVPLAFVFMR